MSDSVLVGDLLEGFARKGVFRGFSRPQGSRSKAQFTVLWHRNQLFQWVWNDAGASLRIACVVPAVPAKSAMYRDLKAWLKARQDDALPAHRRCDRNKLALKTYNRGGDVALTAHVLDGDVEYGVNKLVSLVNEIYLDFLASGLYFEWLVETFELDPDHPY